MKQSVIFAIIATFLLSVFIIGGPQPLNAKKKRKGKKMKDTFYQTARFIMTKEEADIYKHLEGVEDKEQFHKGILAETRPGSGYR